MGEILGAIPALIVFFLLIALIFYLARRNQEKYNDAFQVIAEKLDWTYSAEEDEIKALTQQLQHFPLFEAGGKVEAAAQGHVDAASICLLNVAKGQWGSEQTYTDYYTVVYVTHPGLHLPRMQLRSKRAKVEQKLNEMLFEQGKSISLAPYSALAQNFTLWGQPAAEVEALLRTKLGPYWETLLRRGEYRNLETEKSGFLYYRYQPGRVKWETLREFYVESRTLLQLLLR